MNDRILDIAVASQLISANYNGFDRTVLSGAERRFAGMIIQECIQFIEEENVRLCDYQNSLPDWDADKRHDCDLVIEKCIDLAERLKTHFGVEQ